ncbi:hypothetical protein SAMN02745126_03609 [Enhydrobacter aerosaccus]|uniref:TRAP transporter solute receptor, TAXI family n=1 Tax=Enhydrobacter aerosaccus TaxID=225324 RepID=A0A1T4R5H3_9HYPH|nr:TAXI family TRAP transporter solute-binding subunit [Enhydrobacter aerosaccus]SKA11320.1 hypothetical protein SAMN02745126_03609 [Enhydrobacter aerosaccus]
MRRRAVVSWLAGATLIASTSARSQEVTLSFGTTSAEGGNVPLYSAALLEALKTVDPALEIRAVPTKGAYDNVEQLKRGDIDLGLVSGEIAHEVFAAAAPEGERLRIISATYPTPGLFAVRADSRFRHIKDLVDRPVVWNRKDSAAMVQARYVMGALGLDIDRNFQAIYPERFADAAPLVLAGHAAAMWGSGFRWPPFVTLTDSAVGARFIAPVEDEIVRIAANYPFLEPLTVPARLYPGQYDPIETVGSWSFILARPDLSDATGYRLAFAFHRAENAGLRTKQLLYTTVKNTLAATPSLGLLQSGVARYFRRCGALD